MNGEQPGQKKLGFFSWEAAHRTSAIPGDRSIDPWEIWLMISTGLDPLLLQNQRLGPS